MSTRLSARIIFQFATFQSNVRLVYDLIDYNLMARNGFAKIRLS